MSKHIVNSLLEFAEEMESIGHECEFLEEAATEIMRLRVQVSALEAERDRLASRLKECRAKHMDDLLALSATAKAERELRAELVECRRDAERYRRLCSLVAWGELGVCRGHNDIEEFADDGDMLDAWLDSPEMIAEAQGIDAVLAAGGGAT